jgi:hypothetical protein
MENKTTFYPHLSVDCVLIGFDGTDLKVLLVERSNIPKSPDYHDMKLPGRLIYEGEDLDDAANSVLSEVIKTNVLIYVSLKLSVHRCAPLIRKMSYGWRMQ